MGAQDLTVWGLLALLVFLVPIFYINGRLNLAINRALGLSALRMCVQLGFVGVYLEFLFEFNLAILNLLYLLIMVSIACHSIVRSSQLSLRLFFIPVFAALVIPFFIVLFFFNTWVVRINDLFDAKYLIPIGGMLLGNCLRSLIVGLDRFYSALKKEENTYLFSLSLINNRTEVLKPWFKECFLAAIQPRLASMATIGLVSLPGMMTGQILGGSLPLVAIKYQIAIMLCIFYTEYFATILCILFSIRVGFNQMGVLNQAIFKDK
jgi:putative ABC transport system permease protein